MQRPIIRHQDLHHDGHNANRHVSIEATDHYPGEAPHDYIIRLSSGGAYRLYFTHGIVGVEGRPNGITNEAVLAILIDRFEHYQAGQLPCKENEAVIEALHMALEKIHERTRDRTARGVEGTDAF